MLLEDDPMERNKNINELHQKKKNINEQFNLEEKSINKKHLEICYIYFK